MIATKSQRLYSCSRGGATRNDYWEDFTTCGFVRNRRWWPVTRSGYDVMHISACILDSNETSTAVFMLSVSGYKTRPGTTVANSRPRLVYCGNR